VAGVGMTPEGLVHRFEPGAGPDAPVVLLLHGTGGDENDLLPLGRMVAPGAALLSPRGPVLERGQARFFARLAEGVFDRDDLRRRTDELAAWLAACAARYAFDPARVSAIGYSNGANIAWSVMLAHPAALRRAVLVRPMLPFEPALLPDLSGRAVLILRGERDPVVPAASASALARVLRSAGADVTEHVTPAGHELARADLTKAATWWAAREASPPRGDAGARRVL